MSRQETRSLENFRRALFACPCAYVHNFIPLHWKCKDIYLCRQWKLKQVSLPLSRQKADRIQWWVARRVWIPLQNLRSPYLRAMASILSYGDRTWQLIPCGGCTLVLFPLRNRKGRVGGKPFFWPCIRKTAGCGHGRCLKNENSLTAWGKRKA